ncbi:MAG: hypothetical protein FWG51_03790, partial [Firmicutes bacterium]|nr:hypothetical protein [Bacillota bacterium]
MHGSHKLWIMVAIFLVVIGLLLGMYFTATPDKVGAVIKNKQHSESMQNINESEEIDIDYEDETPQEMMQEENNLPDELKSIDLD